MSWAGLMNNSIEDEGESFVSRSSFSASMGSSMKGKGPALKSRSRKVTVAMSETSKRLEAALLDRELSPPRPEDDASFKKDVVMNKAAARKLMLGNAGKTMAEKQNEAAKTDAMERTKKRNAAATKIQAWFKMCRVALFGPLAFLHNSRLAKKNAAASTIQRVYRGHVARHDPDWEIVIQFRVVEHHAAVDLQRVARGHMGRLRFSETKWHAEVGALERAAALLQRHTRGWAARKHIKLKVKSMKETVSVLERFFRNWFRPWTRAQTKLWDSNLWSIVTVQKKVRRFLAKKRAREIKKARQDMLSSGAWMLGWLLMIGLLAIGSSRERGAGGPTLLREQLGTFFDPPALPGGGRVAGVYSPESAWRWIQEILIPRYRGIGYFPECRSNETTLPSSSSSSSSSSFTVSVRGCGQGSIDSSAATMPLLLLSKLSIWQKRSSVALRMLPRGGTADLAAVCGSGQGATVLPDLTGGVCKVQLEGEVGSANSDDSRNGEGEGGLATAFTEESSGGTNGSDAVLNVLDSMARVTGEAGSGVGEAGMEVALQEQRLQWLLGNYSRGQNYTSVRSYQGDSTGIYGHSVLNFTHNNSIGGRGAVGRLATYTSGGFPLIPIRSNGSEIDLSDPDSTQCGVPCEQGVKRLQIAKWIDAGTSAVIAETAVASLTLNSLVIAQTLIEVSSAGLITASTSMVSGRLSGVATFGDGESVTLAGVPFLALFLFLGVVYTSYIGFTSHYDFRLISMSRYKLHRREGSFFKRSRDFFTKNRYDITTGALVVLAVCLRAISQVLSASLLSQDALNDAAPVDMLAQVHSSSDAALAAAAMMLWIRGIFTFLCHVKVIRAFFAVSTRLVMPLIALFIVAFPIWMSISHSDLLSNINDQTRPSTFRSALGLTVQDMLDAAQPTGEAAWRRTHRRGHAGRRISVGSVHGSQPTARLPSNQAAAFLAGLVLFAAVGAIALAEVEVESKISSEMEASPYIFPGGRRFERYKKWELPQVRELFSWVRRLGHTKAGKKEELRMNLMQARVLMQLRKHTHMHKKTFGWKMMHDRHRLLMSRETRRNLRRLSRMLGLQNRAFNQSADLMESTMEEVTDGMYGNSVALLRHGFVDHEHQWPHADFEEYHLREANRLVEEEHVAELMNLVTVQGKKMRAVERQMNQTQVMVKDVVERWLGHLADQDKEAQERARRRRDRDRA